MGGGWLGRWQQLAGGREGAPAGGAAEAQVGGRQSRAGSESAGWRPCLFECSLAARRRAARVGDPRGLAGRPPAGGKDRLPPDRNKATLRCVKCARAIFRWIFSVAVFWRKGAPARSPGQPLAVVGKHPPAFRRRCGQVVGLRLGYTQTFDVEQYLNSGKTRHVARMSSLYVLGAVRARIRKGPIHRGDRIERDGRGVCSVTVLQHLVLHSELHVSPGGVEFRLAPVLPLLHALPQSRARSGADHWQPVPDSDAEVARIRS